MNTAELKRYDRQMLLPELGIKGQHKLKKAAVLVIGAGGLGCPLLLYLVASGIGKIGIIDHDTIEESNLHRQILFSPADIGKNKAEVAVAKLKNFNPYIDLISYPFKLDANNSQELITIYDLVIDGSDNFPTRYLVNDTCIALHKPFIFGSVFKFEGQLSVFNYNGGPDYRMLYPEPPPAEEVPNCGESGVMSTLTGIIGTYMANQAIQLICGFGDILTGKLLVIDALKNSSMILNISNENPIIPAPDPTAKEVNEITLEILEHWQKNNLPLQLIDVRESYEYEESNIGGQNIPLYEINFNLDKITTDQEIVLYCTTGTRSRIAAQLLKIYLKDKSDKNIFLLTQNLK